jgi:hypothetical protein
MFDLISTHHAEQRMNQRSIRPSEIQLLMHAASQVAEDAFILTNNDVDREIQRRKREIQQLENLRGVKLIVEEGILITAYRAEPAHHKRGHRSKRRQK